MSVRDLTRINNLVCTHRSVGGVRIHVAVGLSLASTDTNWLPEMNSLNVPQILLEWFCERKNQIFIRYTVLCLSLFGISACDFRSLPPCKWDICSSGMLRIVDIVSFFSLSPLLYCGPGSSVGIATDYGLDGPGSNPGGGEIFRPSRPALGSTQPPVKWVLVLSRG